MVNLGIPVRRVKHWKRRAVVWLQDFPRSDPESPRPHPPAGFRCLHRFPTLGKLVLAVENQTLNTSGKIALTFSETAREKVAAALQSQESKDVLRLEARADGTAEFRYAMRLISGDEVQPDDIVVQEFGFRVVLDPTSAKNLNGALVDYEDRVVRSGFKFENPNKPQAPEIGKGPREDLEGPVSVQIQRLLDSELNPAVAAHGGNISLVGIKEKKVYLTFGGGCHGCGLVDVTLKQGVEARIRELIPEIEEVIDVTDHSAGENPFY